MLEKAPDFQGLLLLPSLDNASTKRRYHALLGGLVGGLFCELRGWFDPVRLTVAPDIGTPNRGSVRLATRTFSAARFPPANSGDWPDQSGT